jgi:hypothetical protein
VALGGNEERLLRTGLTALALALVVGLCGCSSTASPSAGVLTGSLRQCTAYQNPKGTNVRVYRGNIAVASEHAPEGSYTYRLVLPVGHYSVSSSGSGRQPVVIKAGDTTHEDIPGFICQ